MGQSPVSGTSEEYPLAADQLRAGESLCCAAAAHGRSVRNVGPEASHRPSDRGLPRMDRLLEEQIPIAFDRETTGETDL